MSGPCMAVMAKPIALPASTSAPNHRSNTTSRQATFYTKGAPHSLHSGVPLPFRFSGNKGSSQVCSENRKAALFPINLRRGTTQ